MCFKMKRRSGQIHCGGDGKPPDMNVRAAAYSAGKRIVSLTRCMNMPIMNLRQMNERMGGLLCGMENNGSGNMILISVLDDERSMVDYVAGVVSAFLKNRKIVGKILPYYKVEQILFDIDEKICSDIYILDIEMPEMSGLQLAKIIMKFNPRAKLIFLTAHLQYAIDAFEVSAFRYVPKTDLEAKLLFALSDAISLIELETDEYIVVNTQRTVRKIYLKEIVYITKSGKNSIIRSLQNEHISVRKSLSELYGEINRGQFLYIDRGCVANMLHISKIENYYVYFVNSEKMELSKSNAYNVKAAVTLFWGNKI